MNTYPKPAEIWEVYFPNPGITDLKLRPVIVLSYFQKMNTCLIAPLTTLPEEESGCCYPLKPDAFGTPKPKKTLYVEIHRIHAVDHKLIIHKQSEINNNVYNDFLMFLNNIFKPAGQ